MAYETDREKVKDDLGDSLLAVVNDFIANRSLHPQQASHVMLAMADEMLGYLAWQPQNVQAAVASIKEALSHMDGAGGKWSSKETTGDHDEGDNHFQ